MWNGWVRTLPHFASIVDDVTLIRSMHTDINGHEPSIWFMNTGKAQPGRPALGSWLTYGLARKVRVSRLRRLD